MLLSSQANNSLITIHKDFVSEFTLAVSYLKHFFVPPNTESVELAVIAIVNYHLADLLWQLKLDHLFVTF